MGHPVTLRKSRVIYITLRYATITYGTKYVSEGMDVNLGIQIICRDAEMTETMSSQMVDT